ncbi:alanine racemase [Aquirhabdus sp.]|uniref:alanine racemase n=1 Tax=Aquirhabdus sp. TaxID=2824160 RepID=UPI00396C5553
MRDARVLLNAKALTHNLHRVREYAPHSHILAMVKADAYGHGLAFALTALQDADALGVAFFQEAQDIRALGNTQPIVVIEGAFSLEEWIESSKIDAQCAIHQERQLEWALQHIIPNATIWLKVNTGMNRLGLTPEQTITAAAQLRAAGYQLVLTTHFANADEPDHPINQQQIDTFLTLKAQLEPIQASMCNSAAIMQWPELHLDWVRPGIMLYGSSPFADHTAQQLNLQPVMSLKTRLIAMHQIAAGVTVGYGARYTTTRPTHLGVVAMGYGDGYPRVVDHAQISINGQLIPIIGRISMDMLTVDLTDLSICPTLDDEVVMWGNEISVDQIAAAAGTIGYELFTRLSMRPVRYITQ